MNKQVTSSGMSLGMVLFIVFLVMRLTDNIDWEWYWVASPLWIPFVVALGVIAVFMLIAGFCKMVVWPFDAWDRAKKRADKRKKAGW
ncbi:MAG TPA: hypothetical protein VIY48_22250 [Candidatus Paceibacterota bacterium]